jgi:putative addiction module component (TIGR02574 family)
MQPGYTFRMNTQLLEQARRLSVQDQLELVGALWEGIADRNDLPGPTDAQKAELDRRISDLEANPDDLIPWSDVKTAALAQLGQ